MHPKSRFFVVERHVIETNLNHKILAMRLKSNCVHNTQQINVSFYNVSLMKISEDAARSCKDFLT